MLPLVAGIVAQLVSNNLPKVAQAVVDKGVSYVEDKLGVPLTPSMSKEDIERISIEAQKHDEFNAKLAFDNTQGARAMQMAALAQTDTFSKRFVYYFITGWSLASIIFIALAAFTNIPEANTRTVDTVLGFILGTAVTSMFNFLLGSTITSRQKNDLLAAHGKNNGTTGYTDEK